MDHNNYRIRCDDNFTTKGYRPNRVVVKLLKRDIIIQKSGDASAHNAARPKRGTIKEFSPKARRTLLLKIRNAHVTWTHFYTLTYNKLPPINGKQAKAHIDGLLTKLRNAYPSFKYVWRMEFQASGAPHFHMLTNLNVSDILLPEWVRIANGGLKPSSMSCMYGVHCINILNPRNTKEIDKYAEYMTKKEQSDVPQLFSDVGRFWGTSRGLVIVATEMEGTLEVLDYAENILQKSRRWDNLAKVAELDLLIDAEYAKQEKPEQSPDTHVKRNFIHEVPFPYGRDAKRVRPATTIILPDAATCPMGSRFFALCVLSSPCRHNDGGSFAMRLPIGGPKWERWPFSNWAQTYNIDDLHAFCEECYFEDRALAFDSNQDDEIASTYSPKAIYRLSQDKSRILGLSIVNKGDPIKVGYVDALELIEETKKSHTKEKDNYWKAKNKAKKGSNSISEEAQDEEYEKEESSETSKYEACDAEAWENLINKEEYMQACEDSKQIERILESRSNA